MFSEEKPFISQTPVLNLSEDAEMLSDFTAEALGYLMSAENSFFALETVPEDRESRDSLFKAFHTIRGLAEFLRLNDIYFLSLEAEKVMEKVRKNILTFRGDMANTISETISSLRKLLMLLNEQVNNQGELVSPYYDISPLIERLRDLHEQRSSSVASQQKQIKKASVPSPQRIVQKDQTNEATFQVSGEQVVIDKEIFNKMTEDLKAAQETPKEAQMKLAARQRELIQERDFAITLSKQAQDTARLKSDLLARMSHEIRTLISSILGFADLLLRGQLNEKQKDQVKSIDASAKLLLGIVNNILDLSKIEKGKLKLESIPFKLDELIDEILRIMKPRLEGKSIEFTSMIHPGVNVNLIGDPTRLKQVIINLFDNAIKFTNEGKISIEVSREKRSPEDKGPANECLLRFSVSDTGIGIKGDKKESIFESFTQAEASTTRQFGGSGLGLSLCRSYVELLGGKIWVESKVTKGSIFVFTTKFKVKDIASDHTEIFDSNVVKLEDKFAEMQDIPCAGIKILVAEDSLPSQELLRAYFETFGCSADFVTTGEEAIEKIENNQYDICLMDLQMPGMGGLEAVRVVRNRLKKDLPVVAVTAGASEDEKNQCFSAGMTDYLSKPYQMWELKEKIRIHTQK